MNDFNIFTTNTEDFLDVRDMIARVEVLRESIADVEATATETGDDVSSISSDYSDEREELKAIEVVLTDLRGNGGDEEWEGDWYPVTLIRDSYFEESMDEMLEDCGVLQPFEDRPSYIKIEIDYRALQMDYTSVEIDGVTYWYR